MARDPLRVALRLKSINNLFDEPDLSPFDPYYGAYSFAAGMDYVVGEMQRRPRARSTELTVLLPRDQIDPGLDARTKQAIDRYATAWATSSRQTRQVERYKTFRVAGAALIFFFVANFLYLRYGQTGSIMGASGIVTDVLVEGLSIASWVVLWWPLDQLIHVGWQQYLDERAYHELKDITLRILPDPDPPR